MCKRLEAAAAQVPKDIQILPFQTRSQPSVLETFLNAFLPLNVEDK